MKRPAVFIDRDGTISEEVGYVNHPSRFRLFPYSVGSDQDTEQQRLAGDRHHKSGRRRARLFFRGCYRQRSRATQARFAGRLGPARRDLLLRASSVGRRAAVSIRLRLSQTKNRTDRSSQRKTLTSIWLRAGWSAIVTATWNWRETQVSFSFCFEWIRAWRVGISTPSWKHQPDLVCENLLEAVKDDCKFEIATCSTMNSNSTELTSIRRFLSIRQRS